jgi:hypothetical protein
MPADRLTQIEHVASDLLEGQRVHAIPKGEYYYAFEITNRQGARSMLPPVWIDPSASDEQLKDKLSAEFRRTFRPESDPDDLSVPGLQTEGKQR